MSVERELIAAITAAPDDDAPRLVYADQLMQRRPRRRRRPPVVADPLPTNKIMAIKEYRALSNIRLAEAKMAVERMHEEATGRPAYNGTFVRSRAGAERSASRARERRRTRASSG